jgi:hypothetical protein
MKKLILLLMTAWLYNAGFSQNLAEAVKQYSTKNHYDYDKTYILKHKIRTLSKFKSIYHKDYLAAYYRFNEWGKPVAKKEFNMYGDSVITQYSYSNRNDLLRKSIFKRSQNNPYNYAISNIYEWQYDEQGLLATFKEYALTGFVPTDNGGYGFPEKLMTMRCEAYQYDFKKSSVAIVNICDNHQYEKYPPSFARNHKQTLRFHENGTVAEEKVQLTEDSKVRRFVRRYDVSGTEFFFSNDSADYFGNWVYKDAPLPAVVRKIIHQDTITVSEAGGRVIRYTFRSGLEGIETVQQTFDAAGKTVLKETYRHEDKTNLLLYSLAEIYEDEKIVSRICFLSASSKVNFSGYHNSWGYHPPVDQYSKTVYEHFDNGLLKSISSYNKNDVQTGKEYYFIEYGL